MHKVTFYYNPSIEHYEEKIHSPKPLSIPITFKQCLSPTLTLSRLPKTCFLPKTCQKLQKSQIFLFLDLKHEGIFLFTLKYIILRIYIPALLGVLYTYFLSKMFEFFPFICFDDNFKLELYDQGMCFCKDHFSKFLTYMRRGLLVVNIIAFCNLEVLSASVKLPPKMYYLLYFTMHLLGLVINLALPANIEYFVVGSLAFFSIFLLFFTVGHLFFLGKEKRLDFNIQFFGIFVSFLFNYIIYCFLNAQSINVVRRLFFNSQLGIMAFTILLHLLLFFISNSRDALVYKCKPKGFIRDSIFAMTNCVFSSTKMGFFLALDPSQPTFYFNALCLVFSNITHVLTFIKRRVFFLIKCHKCRVFKSLGFWKTCLKASLDKKLSNGCFIFERFINYYVLLYVFFQKKYFVDPLDTQNYAKTCMLDLKEEFIIDKFNILAYILIDLLSIFLILIINKKKKLDEIKQKTPDSVDKFKECCLYLGVYYYCHYLFVLGYYIKFYIHAVNFY